MLGFEYNIHFKNPRVQASDTLLDEIRNGHVYEAGSFRNVYAHTEKRVVYVQLPLNTVTFNQVKDLFE